MENDLSTRSREINADSISNVLRISVDIEFWFHAFRRGRKRYRNRYCLITAISVSFQAISSFFLFLLLRLSVATVE